MGSSANEYSPVAGCAPRTTLDVPSALEELVDHLRLAAHDARHHWGRYRDYPLAMTVIENSAPPNLFAGALDPALAAQCTATPSSLTLLLQARYPAQPADKTAPGRFEWGPSLRAVLEQKVAEVSVEDRIAWLTVRDVAARLAAGLSLPTVVDAFLDALAAGGVANDDRCHLCRTIVVTKPSFIQGRVAQVCDTCLAEHRRTGSEAVSLTGPRLLLIPPALTVAAILGATFFSCVWIAYDWLLQCLTGPGGRVYVPHIVLIFAILLPSVLVAAVLAYPIRSLLGRSPLSARIATAAASAAALLGEVGLAGWQVWTAFGSVDALLCLRATWLMWNNVGVPYYLHHLALAGATVLCTRAFLRPRAWRDI